MSKGKFSSFVIILFVLALISSMSCKKETLEPPPPADLVLLDGDIYTVDEDNPRARDMVITGNTITAVLNVDGEADKYIGENTRVIDLKGAFVTPGMIDAHVHYGRAGALINDANLMMVSDEEGLKTEIVRVVELLDKDEWITEGLWGAYEQWAAGDAGETETRKIKTWSPTRYIIYNISLQNRVFICLFDYK